MKEEKKDQGKAESLQKTFTVPFFNRENQVNISLSTHKDSKVSRQQIINQAFKLHSQGKVAEAVNYYQFCISQGIKDHRVFSNYGGILKDLGKLKEAEVLYRQAIKIEPNFAEVYSNLGDLLRDLGDLKEAELLIRKAIKIKPYLAAAYYNLGSILEDLGRLKEASLSLRKAIELKPNFANAHSNLGIILRSLGKFSDADKHLSSASRYAPNNLFYLINSKIKLSPIMKSNSQIDNERSQYKKEITNLRNKKTMTYGDPKSFLMSILYLLPYQNRLDDREILEDFSEAISQSKGIILHGFSHEKYLKLSSKRKYMKIGVCSRFLKTNHSVGKCFINVLKDLSQTDFDMTLYIIPGQRNTSTKDEINDSFKKVINLPNCPQSAAKKILSDQLDLIFYPDIGMDSFSYILALSRLALVQVNGLGHGSTSGIKNVDYYITHGAEPTKSDSNFTETLKRFRRLPFNFSTPVINEKNITLKNVLNSPNIFYIGLIQSLIKLHPTYDEVLESILLKIQNAYLVLITDKNNYKFQLIQDRWRKKNKLLIERSIFLNRMRTDDFLHVTRSCDIMLDPFYFGGGVTFYEAMTFGIPFVTYPKNQKVSIVSAGYKQMKIKNPPIAKSPEDYVNWCKLYSRDKVLLDSTKKELRQKAEKFLFNDQEIYKDYYEFFREAITKSRENI